MAHEVRLPIAIIDALALPAVLFITASLTVHLRTLNNSTTHIVIQSVQTAKKWMQIGALTTLISALCFYALNYLLHYTGGGMSTAYCQAILGIRMLFFGFQKMGVYCFVFWRVSTFNDFFTETGWTRLKVFVASFVCVYSVFYMIVTIVLISTSNKWDTTAGFCAVNRTNTSQLIVLALFVALEDFIANSVGMVCFVRLLWCNPILGQMTQKDPKVGEAARNVVLWSLIAMSTSTLSFLLTLGVGNFGFVDVDMAINGLCISMQYRGSLWALMNLVFGWDEEATEFMADPSMYEDETRKNKAGGTVTGADHDAGTVGDAV